MTAAETEQEVPGEPDWAAFYQNFQKPGYIPGFEIGHKLGGGMFGVVYKARRESIGKAYAIKFLRVEDPAARAQILRELESVKLFAQVDHPNLVSIEDQGMVDGIPYIVMGYAGDETLKSRLEEGTLSEADALQIFVQVARGVHALHEHSLVHFDLKPANIFLKGDVARVGDYGLSKLVSETAMSLTTGRGTPYYMAPEMLRRKADHRADVYSLGIVLFECLSGGVPFRGESEWEVLKAHEEQPVEFPSSVHPRFRPVLERMLAKDPEHRYQSVDEALCDLRDTERGVAVAFEPAPERRSRKQQPEDHVAAAVMDAMNEARRATEAAGRSAEQAIRSRPRSESSWWVWLIVALVVLALWRQDGGMGVRKTWVGVAMGVGAFWLVISGLRRLIRGPDGRTSMAGLGILVTVVVLVGLLALFWLTSVGQDIPSPPNDFPRAEPAIMGPQGR